MGKMTLHSVSYGCGYHQCDMLYYILRSLEII